LPSLFTRDLIFHESSTKQLATSLPACEAAQSRSSRSNRRPASSSSRQPISSPLLISNSLGLFLSSRIPLSLLPFPFCFGKRERGSFTPRAPFASGSSAFRVVRSTAESISREQPRVGRNKGAIRSSPAMRTRMRESVRQCHSESPVQDASRGAEPAGMPGPCNKWHPGPRVLFIPNKSPVRKHPAATVLRVYARLDLGRAPAETEKQNQTNHAPTPPTLLLLEYAHASTVSARVRYSSCSRLQSVQTLKS